MEKEVVNFIDILQEIMIENNLNQSNLAKIIGVKQSHVSEWLSGKSKPGYDNLKSICENLNVSGDKILGIK